ncbi:hypothetical protein ABC766_30290 [Methylobacterium fujisawaense]|uniref:relaxase/mobilization nuclease domain-containing protein n=1 Tax=Methylobacterium fujisawaense TaxID=107400 RepID=UPI0031F51AA1
MISGATRGQGIGDALARHLLKTENTEVVVIPARGLGSADLAGQIRELVALSAGGRTDRPVYHVHLSPDPNLRDADAARAEWWRRFETEFGLSGQPFCGVEHVKDGRRHDHRVYGLVRPDGSVVGLSFDYPRREKISRIVERQFGLRPVASKHARAVERGLRRDGMADVADWLAASGSTEAPRPVAPLTPMERLRQVRTGVALDDVRRAALSAWREGGDGAAFVAALRARGLDLRAGRKGPVVVDASGAAHLATRLIGAAARRFEGERVLAATVRARLAGLELKGMDDGTVADRTAPRRAEQSPALDRGGAGPGSGRIGEFGIRGPGRGASGPDGGGGRRDRGRAGDALGRLRAMPAGRAMILRRRLSALDPRHDACIAAAGRARAAVARMEEEAHYERERAWALWGLTDIWGVPLV